MAMKRSAENQLTKDNADESEIEEIDGDEFRKADEATLARRPMKGLPKRSSGSTPMSTAPTPPPLFGQPDPSMDEDKPKTGIFGGFGSGVPSSFTFSSSMPTSSPIVKPSTTPTVPSKFNFGGSNATPFQSATSSPFSSAPSTAANMFTSIMNNASKPNDSSTFGTPILPNTTITTPLVNGSSTDDSAVKYYSSLRGLNLSLNTAIAKSLEEDPFFDASTILERYKALRDGIQKEFDEKQNKSALSNAMNGVIHSTPSSSAPSFPSSGPPKFFGNNGSTFGSSTPASATTSGFAPTGGFAPSGAASSSFFSTPPAGKTPTSSPFTPSASSAKPFTFGSSDSTSKPSSTGGFTFGSTNTSSNVTTTASSSNDKPSLFTSSTPSVFGSATTKVDANGSKPSSLFGSGSTTPSSSSSIFGKGNIGNSAGFTFGSPTPTPEPESTSSFGLAASGSSSANLMSQGSDKALSPAPSTGMSRGVTPATTDGGDGDETPKILGDNPYDKEGEGEEEEETMHTTRVKVYKMGEVDGKPSWTEHGIGMLRLKKHKETNARRMLCRNSSTGRLMVNFKLYKQLKPTQQKQSISFIGHEDGKSVTFRLRIKDEAGAGALKDAIDREVASLHS